MKNAGYEIMNKETYKIRGERRYSVAIGINSTAPAPYVTWESITYKDSEGKEQRDFFLGHYFESETDAWIDYHRRLIENYS